MTLPVMNDQRTRTVLLAALLTVTGLVIYRTTFSNQAISDRHEDHDGHEAVVVIDEHMPHERRVELRLHLDEMRAELEAMGEDMEFDAEKLRREAEALARQIERDVHVRIERDGDRHHERRMRIRVESGAAARSAEGERMIHEQFEVRSGGDLEVRVPGADVEIETGADRTAEVSVYLEARDMERARDYFEELEFEVHGSDDRIVVETDSDRNWSWGDWRSRGGARIRVVVRIPTTFNVDVSTSGGDIELDNLEGRALLKTSGGDIELGRIRGDRTTLKTSGGDIEARVVESPDIEIQTSGGSISGERLQGERVDVRTSGGSIRFDEFYGDASARTSGGRIEIGSVHGPLDASTSGGRIEVGMRRAHDVSLRTSGGSIIIHAPPNMSADLELKGSRVILDGEFSFRGSLKRNHANGEINGGGPQVSASTSGGNVTLRSGR